MAYRLESLLDPMQTYGQLHPANTAQDQFIIKSDLQEMPFENQSRFVDPYMLRNN